jgi:hypothetical protein
MDDDTYAYMTGVLRRSDAWSEKHTHANPGGTAKKRKERALSAEAEGTFHFTPWVPGPVWRKDMKVGGRANPVTFGKKIDGKMMKFCYLKDEVPGPGHYPRKDRTTGSGDGVVGPGRTSSWSKGQPRPAPPPTAFFLFSKQYRIDNADEVSGLKASEVAKKAEAAWAAIKEKRDSRPFHEAAAKLKEEHLKRVRIHPRRNTPGASDYLVDLGKSGPFWKMASRASQQKDPPMVPGPGTYPLPSSNTGPWFSMAGKIDYSSKKDQTPPAGVVELPRFTTGGSLGQPLRQIGPKMIGPGPGQYKVDETPGEGKPAWTMLGRNGKVEESVHYPMYNVIEQPGTTVKNIRFGKPQAEDMKKEPDGGNGPGAVEWWLSDPFGGDVIGTAVLGKLTATREQARQSSGMEKKAAPDGPDPASYNLGTTLSSSGGRWTLMTGRKKGLPQYSGIEYKHPDVAECLSPGTPAWRLDLTSPRAARPRYEAQFEPDPGTAFPGLGNRKLGEGAVPTVKGRTRTPHSVLKRIASEPGPGTYARDTLFVDERKASPRRSPRHTRSASVRPKAAGEDG